MLKKGRTILQVASVFLGIIYLFSGISKAINISSFYNTITDYGFKKSSFLAPVIVIFEVGISIAFILQLKVKKTALISSLILILFTIIYSYAHFFNNVDDCGCFGLLGKNLAPIWLYIRNFLMLAISIWIYFSVPSKMEIKTFKKNVFFLIILITTYMVGFTYNNPLKISKEKNINQTKFIGKNIYNTPLKNYVPVSNDSIYMMYFFSYTCFHCLNSIENIKQYTKSDYLDNIILIGAGSKDSKEEFYRSFYIPFETYDIDKKEMNMITKKYPTSFFIVNDTIKKKYYGTLPVHQVLRKQQFLD